MKCRAAPPARGAQIRVAAMLFLSLLAACSDPAPPAKGGGRGAAVVEVAETRAGQLTDTWTVLGEVRALERAELAAGAAGPVERVSVREGDAVRAGSRLVEVDLSLVSAELSAARAVVQRVTADLEQARTTRGRVGKVDQGVLAASEVDQAGSRVAALEAELAGAEANVRLAAARLGRHRVAAPFDGVVAKRHVDPGDWVSPGTPVLDLVRVDSVEVRVDAPLDLARRVAVGDEVSLGSITGEIVGVVPALDPVSRTAVIRIVPGGTLEAMVPGTSIDVAFNVQMSGGLVVPRDAVVAGPTASRVFKVVDGTAVEVEVQTLASTAEEILVQGEGLAIGDRLVVRGNERLRPDQAVRIAP